ncbi:g5359 [Coccomyxa elongata]
MLEADLRDLVLSQKYFTDSNLNDRRKAVKRKWTQLTTNRSTTRRVRTTDGGLAFELHDLAVFLAVLKHDEKSTSERESEAYWNDIAALLWHGQIEAFSKQEQLAIAKSLKTACPSDMVTFLETARNVLEQPAEGRILAHRSASSRLGTNQAASIPAPSGAPTNGTEHNNAGAAAPVGMATCAMQGQVLKDLLSAGEAEQQPKILDILTDDGHNLGTATLFFAGTDANFHGRIVGPEFAVVGQLIITDKAAAQSQMAWMSDTGETSEGVTPISAISPGCIIAVPLRCLRLAAEPLIVAAPCQHRTGQLVKHPAQLHGLGTSEAATFGLSGRNSPIVRDQTGQQLADGTEPLQQLPTISGSQRLTTAAAASPNNDDEMDAQPPENNDDGDELDDMNQAATCSGFVALLAGRDEAAGNFGAIVPTVVARPVTGGGRNPTSIANLASFKRCPKCDYKAGNRIGSKPGGTQCPGMVKERGDQGNIILDADGNEVETRCTYNFVSSAEAALAKSAEDATLSLPMLLPPDIESLKLIHLQKSFQSLQEGGQAHRWKGIQCLHGGAAASKVFMTPTVVNLTATTATNVIKEMVINTKAAATNAAGAGRPESLEAFLRTIDCSTHLAALESNGYTLDTLIEDSRPNSVDPLTAVALRDQTNIPDGACRTILREARKLA